MVRRKLDCTFPRVPIPPNWAILLRELCSKCSQAKAVIHSQLGKAMTAQRNARGQLVNVFPPDFPPLRQIKRGRKLSVSKLSLGEAYTHKSCQEQPMSRNRQVMIRLKQEEFNRDATDRTSRREIVRTSTTLDSKQEVSFSIQGKRILWLLLNPAIVP